MAGIYIHIPFCKSRCIYCDFYSTTQLKRRDWYVSRLCQEMHERRNYLGTTSYSTLYLGGGTPSQLSKEQLTTIFASLHDNFSLNQDAEITVEVNPDDVSHDLIQHLKSLGVNRISMGIQTFNNDRLMFLHRRHTSDQARQAVEICKQAGISNISVDLMFGFPDETLEQWDNDVTEALHLDVPHLSAYSLMYEEGTVLTRMLRQGEIAEIDDDLSAMMYRLLVQRLKDAGYQHYEISNFCKSGLHSRHNSSYWNGTPYIGLGAGAHSFDGTSRQWNGTICSDGWSVAGRETLTCNQRFNEKIMTGLRTSTGINPVQLQRAFPSQFEAIQKELQHHINVGNLQENKSLEQVFLTEKGIFISNSIMADLMIPED